MKDLQVQRMQNITYISLCFSDSCMRVCGVQVHKIKNVKFAGFALSFLIKDEAID